MKATERYTALIIEHSQITAVEIAHSPKGRTLTSAGSFFSSLDFNDPTIFEEARSPKCEKIFASELQSFLKKVGNGSKIFSLGLNSQMVLMQTLPIDLTLSEKELTDHIQWEFRQHSLDTNIDGYNSSTSPFVSDNERVAPSIMVSVKKSLIHFFSNVIEKLYGTLHIVDIDQFCAENALLFNYPQTVAKQTVLAGFDEDTFDVSTLTKGKTADVLTLQYGKGMDVTPLAEYVKQMNAQALFLHGRSLTQAIIENIAHHVSCPIEVMDPFRKIALPATLKNIDEIKLRRQDYAAAVGLALREE